MARNRRTTETLTPGSAIRIGNDTELGLAMLIAEDDEGTIEPIAVGSTSTRRSNWHRATTTASYAASNATKILAFARRSTNSGRQASTADYRLLHDIGVHTI